MIPPVKEEINQLMKQGIIQESSSPWNSPAVIVKKPDGWIQLCLNFQELNSHTISDPFPLPSMETILHKASKAKFISKLDLLKGFHQVPMAEKDVPKTSFSTPWGKWEYLRMPFGIKNGPAHFQRCMQAILGNLDFSDVYIDDIILYSNGFEEHCQHLSIILQLLRSHNFKAAPKKVSLFKSQMDFLGHTIGSGCIAPQQAKIQAILSYPKPTTKKGVRTFLGVT